MLNQDFAPAVESPLIIIQILDSIFHKFVVAAFITFVTFVVFAGICVLLSPKLATATALVSSRLYRNIALNNILTLHRVQNCLSRVVTRSPRFSHSVPLLKSLHRLPVRSVQLPIKHFHPSNPHIYIHCSLLQDPFCFGALPSMCLPRIWAE